MTYTETNTNSNGDISFMDRVVRIGLGFMILYSTLYLSIDGNDAYPLIKLFATIVVLTGIAGWDPFYAGFRKIASCTRDLKPSKSLAYPPLS